jgi:thioredoxin reductase
LLPDAITQSGDDMLTESGIIIQKKMLHFIDVVTDEKCETNIDGIFAIGDLREKYARQIVLAAALAAAHCVELKRAQSS